MEFPRITVDPLYKDGLPCIRNLRIPVASVIDMLAEGLGQAEILKKYPDLEPQDIQESLRYAAELVRSKPNTEMLLKLLAIGTMF
jgi:uncharacterized protein (DUF433 family)